MFKDSLIFLELCQMVKCNSEYSTGITKLTSFSTALPTQWVQLGPKVSFFACAFFLTVDVMPWSQRWHEKQGCELTLSSEGGKMHGVPSVLPLHLSVGS